MSKRSPVPARRSTLRGLHEARVRGALREPSYELLRRFGTVIRIFGSSSPQKQYVGLVTRVGRGIRHLTDATRSRSRHIGTVSKLLDLPRPGPIENLRLTRGLFTDPAPVLDTIAKRYGGMCSLGAGPLRVAIVGDPASIREVFAHGADTYRWGHRFQAIGPGVLVGKTSMLGSDGADHFRRRGAVQTAFTRQRINAWAPMIVERTDSAIDDILASATPGKPLDLYPFGRRLILGITLRALFGERWSARTDEVLSLMLRAQSFIEAPALRQLPHPFPVGQRALVRRDRKVLDRMIDEDLADVRARPIGECDGLVATMAFNRDLSDTEIRDQAVTLIGAGFDTTASALAWAVVRLGLSIAVQQKLREEVNTVDEPWELTKLGYAGRVVRECLRLHPAGLLGVRMANTDLSVSGYRVRKGTLVGWSPYLSGRAQDVWSEPLDFDPDRFLRLDDEQRRQTDLAWVPFGRGPHMCIGFALAQLELTLIVARISQRLDIVYPGDEVPRPRGLVVNRPVGGAPAVVTPAGNRAGRTTGAV